MEFFKSIMQKGKIAENGAWKGDSINFLQEIAPKLRNLVLTLLKAY